MPSVVIDDTIGVFTGIEVSGSKAILNDSEGFAEAADLSKCFQIQCLSVFATLFITETLIQNMQNEGIHRRDLILPYI